MQQQQKNKILLIHFMFFFYFSSAKPQENISILIWLIDGFIDISLKENCKYLLQKSEYKKLAFLFSMFIVPRDSLKMFPGPEFNEFELGRWTTYTLASIKILINLIFESLIQDLNQLHGVQ